MTIWHKILNERTKCRLLGHPNLTDVAETGGWAEDLIAGTYSLTFEGWCPTCCKTISWTEAHP